MSLKISVFSQKCYSFIDLKMASFDTGRLAFECQKKLNVYTSLPPPLRQWCDLSATSQETRTVVGAERFVGDKQENCLHLTVGYKLLRFICVPLTLNRFIILPWQRGERKATTARLFCSVAGK